jgi:hypothetical protein
MKILAYSPSVEAYIGTHDSYYDLSSDITSCTVGRRLDATSTFTIRLANRNHKYNGVFMPMDRVTIFTTKGTERTRLITGYVTKVSAFTLYEEDFEISGEDTLYRLQRMYFDPGLRGSYDIALADIGGSMLTSNGYQYAYDLLTKIGGWPSDSVLIDENMPGGIIDWARRLYSAQQSDLADAETMVKEFYDLLKQSKAGMKNLGTASGSGGTASLGGGGTAEFQQMKALWTSNEGQWSYSQGDGRLDPESSGYSDCSACIWWAINKIDPSYSWLGTSTYTMLTTARHILDVDSPCYLDTSKMVAGDLIIMQHRNGVQHVDWYFGNNVAWGAGSAPLPHHVTDDVANHYATDYPQNWVNVCRCLDQTGATS